MQFNSEANGLDLYTDAQYLAGADTASLPIATFTRLANLALDRAVSLIFKADNNWEYDDTNNSDLPIATTSLVANQQDYSIPVTHLKILRVRMKDPNGNWITLEPVNRRERTDAQLTAPSATPNSYDKLGNSLFLYPTPSYASSDGLEVQFQRGASLFTTTDTTKTPGFATQFHRLISLYPALDYCVVEDLPKREARLQKRIDAMEAELIDFYSSRDFDAKQSMTTQEEDYGQSALRDNTSNNPNGF